jgi:hypothetical protein
MLALLVFASLSMAQQGPPEMHPEDSFLCYKAKASRGEVPVPAAEQAVLTDQFETDRPYEVKKERGICNPADDDGEGIVDPAIHLTAYKLRLMPGEPRHLRQENIRVFNQFGNLYVDTIKEDRLLMPATKDEAGGPVSAPDNASHEVDHYKCYKVKVTKGKERFPRGVQVDLSDQFEDKPFDVKKPKLLCTPVDKDGVGMKHPDGHLMCYKVKPAKGEAKHESRTGISVADDIVIRFMDTKKEELLCVPSLKNPVDFCGDRIINQEPLEECDGELIDNCETGEICSEECACTLCGNAVIDPGEDCEEHADCPGQEICTDCLCELQPPLGQRTFSLGPESAFLSGFLPGIPVANPVGTLAFDAGSPDESGFVPVTLLAPPYHVAIDIVLGIPETQCWRYTSCTGSLYCSGGANVDVLTELNSLPASEPMCIRDGTNYCPDVPESVCCSNSCEGTLVGGGNTDVLTTGVNPTDSGVGAMVLSCDIDILMGLPYGSDCLVQDYSGVTPRTLLLTTGTGTSVVTNHCSANGQHAEVPTFANNGENFDCASWTTENGAGILSMPVPAEEPSPFVVGDGSNALVLVDASPSGAFLEGTTGVLD